MRKVILFMHVSLDGFVCGPDGQQDWMTKTDGAMDKELIPDLLRTVDTMLVGRVLYQGFAQAWPAMAKNPASPKELVEMARWMEETPKVVFSKTLDKVEWGNSRLVKGDVAQEVAKLKQQPGGDMVIFGGAGIVQTFTKLGLVDEYRIKLEPVILGKGKPLFKEMRDEIRLKLTRAKGYDSGVVGLNYETVRN